MKLLSGECYGTPLMRSQHQSRYWLGIIRHQAITWTNVNSQSPRSWKTHLNTFSLDLLLILFIKCIKNHNFEIIVIFPCDQCINSLSLSDAYMRHQPSPSLGQIMACRQAIIWTNSGILSIEPLGTNVSEILIEIYTFSLKKMHLKMCAKWQPFCLGLNVLIEDGRKK